MASISIVTDRRSRFLQWQETMFNDQLKKFESAEGEEKKMQIIDLWTQCCSPSELDSRLDRWLIERQTFLSELHAWVEHRNNQTCRVLERVIKPENPRDELMTAEAWSKLESAMTINDGKWKAYTSENDRLNREAPFLLRSFVHLGGDDAMNVVEQASSDWNNMADAQVIAALRHLSKVYEDLYDFEVISEQRDIAAAMNEGLRNTTDYWRNVLGRRDSSVLPDDGNAHDKILDDDLLERWKKWTDALSRSFHNWIVPPKQMRVKGKGKAMDVEYWEDVDDQPPNYSGSTVDPNISIEEAVGDEAQADEQDSDRLGKASRNEKGRRSKPDLPKRDFKGLAKILEEPSEDDESEDVVFPPVKFRY